MAHLFINPKIVFKITGKDSSRYLNARLTNDISKLEIGKLIQAAALDSRGRVEGFFDVLKLSLTEFIVVSERGDVEKLNSVLTKYIVADQVKVEQANESYSLLKIFNNQSTINDKQLNYSINNQLIYELLLTEYELEKSQQNLVSDLKLNDKDYEILRYKYGILRYPDELNEDLFFPEANLEHALSRNKGCYVGQEPVEMAYARGKVSTKIKTLMIKSTVQIAKGTQITNSLGDIVGKTLTTYSDQKSNSTYCFIRLKSNVDTLFLSVNGHQANLL